MVRATRTMATAAAIRGLAALAIRVLAAPVGSVQVAALALGEAPTEITAMAGQEAGAIAVAEAVAEVRIPAVRVAEAAQGVKAAQVPVALDPAAAILVVRAVHRVREGRVSPKRYQRAIRRRGLTLLELILALSLSVLVLMAIGMAIDLHYRMFDVRRTNIEEAHVARAVLRNIADDLRAAVQFVPPDLEGLEAVTGNAATAAASMLSGQASEGGSGGGTGNPESGNSDANVGETTGDQSAPSPDPMGFGQSAQSGSPQTGGSPMGGTQGFGALGSGLNPGALSQLSAGQAAAPEETGELGQAISVVGLYGSTTQLQFDISRLPRVDEYEAILSPTSDLGVVDIPSDIKTVTYFVCSEDTFDAAKAPSLLNGSPQPSTTGRGRGLMRRELSQAVSSWAESNGNLQSTYSDARLLAEEVVALQFRYYDGVGWLDDWNSDELGGLPVAVEVTVTIQPTYAMSEEALAKLPVDAIPPEKVYSLIVHLPASRPGEMTTTAEDTAAGDAAVLQEAGP